MVESVCCCRRPFLLCFPCMSSSPRFSEVRSSTRWPAQEPSCHREISFFSFRASSSQPFALLRFVFAFFFSFLFLRAYTQHTQPQNYCLAISD
jgi:hypothetical protein